MAKILCLISAFFFTFSLAHAEEWKTYVNKRFGYSFEYPASFTLKKDSGNKSEVELYESKKGNGEGEKFQISADAGFVPQDYSLKTEWTDLNVQQFLQKIEVFRKEKQADSYTIVTMEKGNMVFQKKCVKNRNWASLSIIYPIEDREKYEPVAKKIRESFVPFLSGNYDRTPPRLAEKSKLYSITVSPNGKYEVAHGNRKGVDGGEKLTVCIVNRKTGKILYQWGSILRYTEALWNETSTRVAVNDCIANSGDVLYVLKVSDDSAKLLRQPDESGENSLVKHVFPDQKMNWKEDRYDIGALKWLTPHKLLVGVRADRAFEQEEGYKKIILNY